MKRLIMSAALFATVFGIEALIAPMPAEAYPKACETRYGNSKALCRCMYREYREGEASKAKRNAIKRACKAKGIK